MLLPLAALVVLAADCGAGRDSSVSVQGRNIVIDGEPLFIQGVRLRRQALKPCSPRCQLLIAVEPCSPRCQLLIAVCAGRLEPVRRGNHAGLGAGPSVR